jgi:hypothetical protein
MIYESFFIKSFVVWLGVLIARVQAVGRAYPCNLPETPPPPMVVSCAENQMAESLSMIVVKLTKNTTGIFEGVLFHESTAEFEIVVEQYASPTFPERSSPTVIAQPRTESDVRAVVLYAKQCNYTLKLRSGGHSYLALSSCDASDTHCVQIDMSLMNATYLVNNTDDGSINHATQLVVQPGLKLEGLHDVMNSNNIFLPTGECAKVGLGGHVQTGGFGMW